MNNGIIYISTNKINSRSYIGQTVQELYQRIRKHYWDSVNRNHHFANALKKYKKEDWSWKILYNNIPIGQLNNMEKWCIANYDTFNNGYNSDTGGKNGRKLSDETKIKIGLSNKGLVPTNKGKKMSGEFCKKISGENHPMYGKFHTNEARKKISDALSGRPSNNKGKKMTEEQKEKLSISHKGQPAWNKGIKHSSVTKDKISKSLCKNTYKITTPNDIVIIVNSIKKYCKENNLDPSNMYSLLKGKRKYYKGYQCEMI